MKASYDKKELTDEQLAVHVLYEEVSGTDVVTPEKIEWKCSKCGKTKTINGSEDP